MRQDNSPRWGGSRALLATLMMVAGLLSPQVRANCEDSYWPIFAGGAAGSEDVRCFTYDPANQLIIVGGVTRSEDFAPAPNDHGYLFALDLYGNWKWGSFFYNVSYAVSSIDGCQMSSDGSSLAMTGLGNSMPLLMDINTVDGTFNRFISLDYMLASADVVPDYETFGAIYYDVRDYRDYAPYFYTAFIKDTEMFMLRVLDNPEANGLLVDWNYRFAPATASELTADPLFGNKEPNFITPSENQQMLYLVGRYEGKGSIVKFQKRDGTVRWYVKFNQLTRINAYSIAKNDDDLFVCGEYQPNEATDPSPPGSTSQFSAAVARVKEDGDISWYRSFQGTHPLKNVDATYAAQDRCMGIAYYKEQEELTVLLQSKMSEVRNNAYKGDFYDAILIKLSESGDNEAVVTISQGNLNYDMFSSKNGIFMVNDYVYMAGYSYGYQTNLQTLTKDTTALEYDAYVYKHKFGIANQCLFITESDRSTVRRNSVITYGSGINSAGIATKEDKFRALKMNKEDNYFVPYTSRHSGGFTLLDTMKIPRPCAFQSQNLTAVTYYRGQNTMQYNLRNQAASPLTYIDNSPVAIFQDGSDASSLAAYNEAEQVIDIQSDADDMVGVQKILIRDCNRSNRLIEMNLYVEVLANTYPDFVTEPETSFRVAVNDVKQYQLPDVVDPEGNDEPEVYVGYMDQQVDKYPEFLQFNNATRTITLSPDSKRYAGRTFYFTIVVKEKNSDSVKYSFYATVRVDGTITDDAPIAWNIGDSESGITVVNYTINWVDDQGNGSLQFTSPIHMQWLEENFVDFFYIYWRDTNFRNTREDKELADFVPTLFNEDGVTVNFTMTFHKPYRIGLLVKKSDRIHIDVKMSEEIYNQTGALFIGDPTTYRLGVTAAKHRLEMIFDWDNDVMSTMRNISETMYWVLIGIIVVQFFALLGRGVGLLPMWVFIEYLQLVGFMPIYNFRLIPYLYDAFKPSLVAHMILFDDTPFIEEMDEDYFNKNYENYWLSVGKLFQSFVFVCIFLAGLLIANAVVYIIYKINCSNPTINNWASKAIVQFKFNAYIRYYMLVYFDTTFFAVMKIMDPNNHTMARKVALCTSYVVFILNIALPGFLIAHINCKFDILAMKEAKQSFNTLLLKIDKASRWRIMNPAYFFARRLLTAMLLTLPIENTFIFLQYVFILMSSHAYILYMVAVKPFQTPGINSYVLASETFYSALIIAIFIFSDATPEMSIKFGAGVALIVSLIMLVVSNLVMNIFYMWQGPEKIKATIKQSTLKRAEKEALERAEEEERKLKKKKEEEEFTKIPDETINMSSMDQSNTTQQNATIQELNQSKKKGKGKKKGQEDNVADGAIGGVGQDDFSQPTKKRRRKEKAKDDDLAEGNMAGSSGPKKSKKRKQKKEDAEQVVTNQQQTDFATQNPTQKDFL